MSKPIIRLHKMKYLEDSRSVAQFEVPAFCNEQERLDWIEQQIDKITVLAVKGFRQRLSADRRRSKRGRHLSS